MKIYSGVKTVASVGGVGKAGQAHVNLWSQNTPPPSSQRIALSWWRGLGNETKLWTCCAGPPKMDGSWWRALKNMIQEPHKQYEKAKRNNTGIWNPRLNVSNMLLGKSRGQLLVTPERMNRLDQSRNDTWSLAVKAKSDVIKNNIA